jgi:hypothetical protein
VSSAEGVVNVAIASRSYVPKKKKASRDIRACTRVAEVLHKQIFTYCLGFGSGKNMFDDVGVQ